jgi:tetratricopeptide (TPR) repeat protein
VGVTLAIGVQAMIEGDLGDHERAAATMATAARMSLALGQSAHAATQLTNLSYLHLSHGRWVEAQAVARDALALCERARLVQPVPPLTFNLAIAATGLGEFTEADRLCLEALQRAQALANGDIESGAAAQRVRVAIEQQAWEAARSRLGEALPIARAGPYRQAQCDLVLSHLRIAAAAAKSGAGPGPDPRWLRWYLAQEDRQAAEREIAQALLERLGTKARRGPVPDLALSDLLQAIAQTLGG